MIFFYFLSCTNLLQPFDMFDRETVCVSARPRERVNMGHVQRVVWYVCPHTHVDPLLTRSHPTTLTRSHLNITRMITIEVGSNIVKEFFDARDKSLGLFWGMLLIYLVWG